MDTSSAWTSTPPTSERIVSAISRIAAVLRAGTWQFATSEGLNPTQVEIVEMLAARQEGVRVSWIAQQLGVTVASASDSIAALTAKGLVEKGRAPDDGRAVALRLTAPGRELADRIAGALGFAYEAVDGLPGATQEALYGSLLALIGRLQQAHRFPEIRACLTCKHFVAHVHQDTEAPHHCQLVNAPLPAALLRLDCPEHVPADPGAANRNWRQIEEP
ncbi:MarR family winged helix-turn-helix transcriptional regulator [Pseudogulbenkiania sp. MAI-1]|uniref:MarR family winged helix-turn-helix transcriptional regulator n=1 Tax=Pseudogulbenkiania sp. MAI-1 TaxID=990370 RepID=UPI00045E9ADC|nr:MarR family winged helix-turn-helix transcriptional regulator [Pseudogulbenkiania sp. MAI-1]